MKNRSEIEQKYKWDLTKFCKDEKDFYNKLDALTEKLEEFKNFEGKLSSDDTLLKYLKFKYKFYEDTCFDLYPHLRQSEDASNRQANEMCEKLGMFYSKLSPIITSIETEIDKFSLDKLKRLVKEPKFSAYKRFFEETIRHKKHSLSKKEEVLLSKMGECLGGCSESYDKFSDVDLKFDKIKDKNGKEHEFSQSRYSLYAESEDRVLRENAFKEINSKRGDFIHFLASNYISNVKEDCVIAKIRKYKSALEEALYCEEIDPRVYDMLIKKVRENVELQHRYFELKRKMLKLDKFAIYDTFAPVSKNTKKFTYDEAIEIIKKAVAVLGEEYVNLIQRAKDERWIDVMPNKNKDSGAYSTANKGATPVVLTNFEGNLESVFTLAHELGHAMHSYFSNKTQPIQTAYYTIFVAEVASTTNEQLLLQYLLKNAKTDAEKISYYDYFLKEMRSCIFRQTMFAEFEEFAHAEYEKEHPLSCELLCEKYKELNDFYHGKKVVQIPEMKYEWARIPHFYRSFYVYKYAIGLICSLKISSGLLSDGKFADKYIKFLSSGCSKDPVFLLKIADCDLTQEKTFDDAFDMCEKYIKLWEDLLHE